MKSASRLVFSAEFVNICLSSGWVSSNCISTVSRAIVSELHFEGDWVTKQACTWNRELAAAVWCLELICTGGQEAAYHDLRLGFPW
jgi:hypothetical protein